MSLMKPGKTGIPRILDATKYSWQGLKGAWLGEAAFRQELALAVLLVPLAFVLGGTTAEIAIMLLTLGVVLMAELANSAIEAVVDRIGSEQHPLSGRAKDIGSAMVFIALLFTGIVWGTICYFNFFT
ncbi:diacylglycerol kinase [Kangiella koreensis]|uniref:Diacylglycerol kinase n=1 Tax=Kangiella koreensis (strain DSM 16069 / JCM 12317 / KCTC 12182 / SW-125) TaxID=523791 RepID=C7R780_KANKD|nr:diacylglycerol kinase [Kangiella koreensis DSM 16069]